MKRKSIIPHIYILKDVARLSGHSIYTIKFYLQLGLIREIGRSPETRFRYFNPSTLKRLTAIRKLQKTGKSLSDIKRILHGGRV